MNNINNFVFESEKDEKNKANAAVLVYVLSIVNEYMESHEDTSEFESFVKEKGYLEDLKETNFYDDDKEASDSDILEPFKKMIDKLYKADDDDKIDESYSSTDYLIFEKEEDDKEKALETLVDASEGVSASDFHTKLQEERKKSKKEDRKNSRKARRAVRIWGGLIGGMFGGASFAGSTMAAGGITTVLSSAAAKFGFGAAVKGTALAAGISVGTGAVVGAAAIGTVAAGTTVVVNKKRKNRDLDLAGLQSMVDNESDAGKKAELQKKLDIYSKAHVMEDGRTRFHPFIGVLTPEERKEYSNISKNVDENRKALRKEGNKYIKDKGDSWKDNIHEVAKKGKEEFRARKKQKKEDNKQAKDSEEEVIVKDKDGSQIHQRAKKVGDGYTYVRTKGGKETGYASKEDFQKAQQRKAKKQNESLECISLVEFLCS